MSKGFAFAFLGCVCVHACMIYFCVCTKYVHVEVCTLFVLCNYNASVYTRYVGSTHLYVLVFLQYDEVAEHRKIVATKKRKLDAMEEQWRVCHIHHQYYNILIFQCFILFY